MIRWVWVVVSLAAVLGRPLPVPTAPAPRLDGDCWVESRACKVCGGQATVGDHRECIKTYNAFKGGADDVVSTPRATSTLVPAEVPQAPAPFASERAVVVDSSIQLPPPLDPPVPVPKMTPSLA